MGNITFMMIKPDAVENGFIGDIIEKVTSAGFSFKALKLTQLSKINAEQFYKVHKDRPFYNDLVKFISRSPIVVAILEKENAVSDFRTLIGATNPDEAAEGTIRKHYGKSMGENAVHGSDSDENALIESSFHFAGVDLY
ncbi:MAG: nucleoside-diphosphate kinase [Flavobacteriaceae bacterium]